MGFRWGWHVALAVLVAGPGGCGGDDADDEAIDVCADFTVPERPDTSGCAPVDVDAPGKLSDCALGSGHAGRWIVDGDGLPAYDFAVDQRCDPAGQHWSPRERAQRDPVHLIGNGRGLVAMAHASGGVEVYTQDRGHKWLNRIDTWRDPETPEYPVQLGGGFNYLVVGDEVRSTRFEDLPVGEAVERQTRRFGVGYYETVTDFDDLRVTRRVFAPDTFARALVVEITLENLGDGNQQVGLVELWDPNMHQVPVEPVTSDLSRAGLTREIDRRRRALAAELEHTASYAPTDRAALLETRAVQLPDGVSDRDDVSEVDWFPESMYLAVIDQGEPPDAVWLRDEELWGDDSARPVPVNAAGEGPSGERSVELDGAGQPAVLAMRTRARVPVGASVTRRFAFGYLPEDQELDAALSALRGRYGELRRDTVEFWREQLVWAAFPGLEDAGAVQRELAWSSYYAQAGATFDELRGLRVLGQGGAYKYIHGLDGAIGDLCLLAEGLALIDPLLARDTLAYALSTQHGADSSTPWRFPYASTGVGDYSDVGIHDQRSDAYFLIPSAIARYVALTRDSDFLGQEVGYWPPGSGAGGTVVDHLRRTMQYATDELGNGARGLVAMGTGDYADGVLELADGEATPGGSSSSYNAGFVVHGFPLAADVIEPEDAQLAGQYRAVFDAQASALNNEAWSGRWYERGFIDGGAALAPDVLFLEPQLFPVLAGIVGPDRASDLLDLAVEYLETDIGAMSAVTVQGSGGAGGFDEPQIGGIWPAANAWLTEAYALRDPGQGWSSFVRNTLQAHARAYPELWYGIWTGPASYNGPDHERAGEADAHLATALTDYPAFNMHAHLGPLRALVGIVGIEGTPRGLRIDPKLPTATYTVKWPRLELSSREDEISGSVTPMQDGSIVMQVTLPGPLRPRGVTVTVGPDDTPTDFQRSDDHVIRFVLTGRRNQPATWSIH